MEFTNLGHETEHIEFKKSIAEMKEAIISIGSFVPSLSRDVGLPIAEGDFKWAGSPLY